MANLDIREKAKSSGVRMWEIAYGIGISDAHFSRKLRFELSQEEKNMIFAVIDRLAQEKEAS